MSIQFSFKMFFKTVELQKIHLNTCLLPNIPNSRPRLALPGPSDKAPRKESPKNIIYWFFMPRENDTAKGREINMQSRENNETIF